jgi:2-isopropylmalate synthase
MPYIELYDTTLRDGAQSEDVAFSLEDKIKIAIKLDELGIHYIEGGYPGSNQKDFQFFRNIKEIKLENSKIVAFGSTRKSGNRVHKDSNILALLMAETEIVTIVGKGWDLHVTDALGISLEENLDIIYDSIKYLKERVNKVFFDAEHFFDGYKANSNYAMKVIKSAQDAGADSIILCDTNGGSLPYEIRGIIEKVKEEISTPLGIHTHNDSDMAVANSIVAVEAGVIQVQGTINGFGERCGNANLCSIIPNLKLKMDIDCVDDNKLKKLREISRFVDELANVQHNKRQPYVGDSAFAHKGGLHVSGIRKNPRTYEHVKPELVGNRQRVLVSDLSGKSNILYKAWELNIDLKDDDPVAIKILNEIKNLENKGFQFEGAEGSFELLIKKAMGSHKKYFDLEGFRVISDKRSENEPPYSEATIIVKVDGVKEHTAAIGNGPVNALDNALRKALEKFYPNLKEVELLDYKVRVLSTGGGTGSSVRVLIESGDKEDRWGTVGVSENIIEASWQALVDSIEYKLAKDERKNL